MRVRVQRIVTARTSFSRDVGAWSKKWGLGGEPARFDRERQKRGSSLRVQKQLVNDEGSSALSTGYRTPAAVAAATLLLSRPLE